MKSTSQQWLKSQASPPGTLACGLRRPDGQFVCHSVDDKCPVDRMEMVLSMFESLHKSVVPDARTPRWTTWSFEQGHIRFAPRPDGWLLGLVVRSGSEAFRTMDPTCTEFLAVALEG